MFKKLLSILACATVVAGILTGCGKSEKKLSDVEIANFTKPVKGEKIAVITVKDFGTIKIKLFPEVAPKGVENFEGLAGQKYYDELIFHRVVKDFVIQGGDPKGNGKGGHSIWGDPFKNETSDTLRHFPGAVAYANSGADTNGSQFYIVTDTSTKLTEENFKTYSDKGINFPQNVKDKYIELGGAPTLDGGYTIFGQVFEGMDVVDKISKVDVADISSNKPVSQVLMEKVEIVEYEG